MENFHLENIFAVQCRLVGADYNTIDRTKEEWYYKYEWDIETEDLFIKWLADYIYKMPGVQRELYGRNHMMKFDCLMAAYSFNLQYGWKLKEIK